MWSLAGSQAVDQPFCCFGTESCGLAGLAGRFGTESSSVGVRCFGPVGGEASLCFQGAPIRDFRCGRPAGVSGVGPQSANLGAGNQASGERRGCLSQVHRPGAEGGGAPETAAAAENFPNSH